jgi:hypothetical protein
VVNGGGAQTRDFPCRDLAQVLAKAVDSHLAAAGAPVNVAAGVQTSIATLADAVAAFPEIATAVRHRTRAVSRGRCRGRAPSIDRLRGCCPT